LTVDVEGRHCEPLEMLWRVEVSLVGMLVKEQVVYLRKRLIDSARYWQFFVELAKAVLRNWGRLLELEKRRKGVLG
jgi:hypothetical protein